MSKPSISEALHTQDHPAYSRGTISGVAQEWQGFESRFPKDSFNKPKDRILIPGVIQNDPKLGNVSFD